MSDPTSSTSGADAERTATAWMCDLARLNRLAPCGLTIPDEPRAQSDPYACRKAQGSAATRDIRRLWHRRCADRLDHQVLHGRRATGRTDALAYLASERALRGDVALTIDLRTVGSPDGVLDPSSATAADRATCGFGLTFLVGSGTRCFRR
jgi:hypothetical protein